MHSATFAVCTLKNRYYLSCVLKCTIEKVAIIRAPSVIPKTTKPEENLSDICIYTACSVKSQTDQNPDPLTGAMLFPPR